MNAEQITFIERRLSEIHEDINEVKVLAKETNGRVRTLELWRAKVEGAKWAVGWVPPMATAAAASGLSVLLSAIFLT